MKLQIIFVVDRNYELSLSSKVLILRSNDSLHFDILKLFVLYRGICVEIPIFFLKGLEARV